MHLLGRETACGVPGPMICPAHQAVLGGMLASSRVKNIRELLIGLSPLEEAKGQLDAWWASGCQQDRCIKSGL